MLPYRYRLYHTDQHHAGTDNYRYSNGQRFRVYWLYWDDKWLYIQDRWIVSAGRYNRPRGGNAGWPTRDPMRGGGGGEVKVVSVETHGQPDAGWLAATRIWKNKKFLLNFIFIIIFFYWPWIRIRIWIPGADPDPLNWSIRIQSEFKTLDYK